MSLLPPIDQEALEVMGPHLRHVWHIAATQWILGIDLLIHNQIHIIHRSLASEKWCQK